MPTWAMIYATTALRSGLGSAENAFAQFAGVLSAVAIAVFLVFLVPGLIAGRTIRDAID